MVPADLVPSLPSKACIKYPYFTSCRNVVMMDCKQSPVFCPMTFVYLGPCVVKRSINNIVSRVYRGEGWRILNICHIHDKTQFFMELRV